MSNKYCLKIGSFREYDFLNRVFNEHGRLELSEKEGDECFPYGKR